MAVVTKIGPRYLHILLFCYKLSKLCFKGDMADSGSSNALEDISKCIKRHDEALEALKEVLSILKKLAETVGGDNNQPIKKADWSLGLSDDENDQIDEDSDANKIINDGDNEESEGDKLNFAMYKNFPLT